MVHVNSAGGPTGLHIDHFNPTISGRAANDYGNLMLAVAGCNIKKSDHWPSWRKRKLGLRFLNCTEEKDYCLMGKDQDGHIFEDVADGKLYGKTPAGRYHIEKLRLNSPWLITLRKRRTDLLTDNRVWHTRLNSPGLQDALEVWGEIISEQIPQIAKCSPDDPAFAAVPSDLT